MLAACWPAHALLLHVRATDRCFRDQGIGVFPDVSDPGYRQRLILGVQELATDTPEVQGCKLKGAGLP